LCVDPQCFQCAKCVTIAVAAAELNDPDSHRFSTAIS
jgi:hypothetical protein